MKTIEEKAKAYDEALEKAKAHINSKGIGDTVDLCKHLFSELSESEDERIIEEIKFAIMQMPSEREDTKQRCLAYLEKQKEQKPNIEICPHSIKSKSYKENYYPIEDCDYGLEIAFDILEKTFGEVRGYQTDDGIREHQTAIEAVRKAKEQKPAEWHPEDEQNLNVCLSYIKDELLRSWLIDAIHVRYDKPAWSEEDEVIVKFYEDDCNYRIDNMPMKDVIEMRLKFKDWVTNRIKYLRPSWKPSEEQMKNLEYYVSTGSISLKSLYNDLLKLKSL